MLDFVSYLRKKAVLILIAVSLMTYVNVLPNSFLWDDEVQIVANPALRQFQNLSKLFLTSTGAVGGADASNGFYRPLMFTFYLLAYQIGGLTSWPFHLFQILLHLGNVLLIYYLLNFFLKKQKVAHHKDLALVVSLVFAVHPVNVEAVAYLGALGEPLSTFLFLGAFLLLIKASNPSQKRVEPNLFFGSLTLIFWALLGKETAASFFPLATAYLLWQVRPGFSRLLNYLFAFAATLGAYLFLRLIVAQVSFAQPHVVPIAQASLWQRLITIPYELVTYFGLVFFPWHLQIYRNFVVTSFSDVRFWGSLFLLLALAGVLWFWLKKLPKRSQRLALAGVVWFGFTLLPALNLVPLNMTVAERWLYLPLPGLILFLVLACHPLWEKVFAKNPKVIVGSLVLILLFFFGRSLWRTFNWRSGLVLYGHDIRYGANNAQLENNYGVELFRIGKEEEASHHFQKSVALEGKWSVSRNNLGAVLEKEGKLEEALGQYGEAIKLSDYYLAYENYANLLLRLDRVGETKQFIQNQALPRFSGNSNLYTLLALVYFKEGDTKLTYTFLQKALILDQENQKARQLYQALLAHPQ